MSEKRRPTYPLQEIKELIMAGRIADALLTVTESANEMGLTVFEAHQEILTLERGNFFKSMTDYHNHMVWQDVYMKNVKGIRTYIKFKVFQDKFLLLSFKPDETKEG